MIPPVVTSGGGITITYNAQSSGPSTNSTILNRRSREDRDAEIRRLVAEGRYQYEVAELFEMSQAQVSRIITGQKEGPREHRRNPAEPVMHKGSRVRCCPDAGDHRCLCGRTLCEDHALMTVDGVRCGRCLRTGS